jgi:DNA-binding transcriptional LysR family regulator
MKRAQRLANFWAWLPAFRAVAETQHLPTAAQALHLTPSALSRTIRLLEQELGQPLFDRVGRQLQLNATGQRFLAVIRESMRLVDEGLSDLEARQYVGPLHVATAGPLAALLVLPAFERLADAHPGLVPCLHQDTSDAVPSRLLQGRLDAALMEDAPRQEGLERQLVGELSYGVHCASSHPLATAREPSTEDVLESPVVAATAEAGGWVDRWPAHLDTEVALRVSNLEAAIAACSRGRLLAPLPDIVGAAHDLHRLPLELIAPSQLFVLHRARLGVPGRTEAFVEALGAAAEPLFNR